MAHEKLSHLLDIGTSPFLLDPRARDVSNLLGDPSLNNFLIKHRLSALGLSILNATAMTVSTWTAFGATATINPEKRLLSTGLYVGTKAINKAIESFQEGLQWTHYQHVMPPTMHLIRSVHPKIMRHILASTRSKGHPSFTANTNTIFRILNEAGRPNTPKLIEAGISIPTQLGIIWTQEIAAIAAALSSSIAASLGIRLKASKSFNRIETTHIAIRDALRQDGMLFNRLTPRIERLIPWLESNTQEYSRAYRWQILLSNVPLFIGGIASLFSKNPIGTFLASLNLVDSNSTAIDTITVTRRNRNDAKFIKDLAMVIRHGPYVTNEVTWDEFRNSIPIPTTIPTHPQATLILENAQATIIEDEKPRNNTADNTTDTSPQTPVMSPPLNATIYPNMITEIRGESGSGKSIFVLALTGWLKHQGEFWVRTDQGDFKNLRQLPWNQLKKIVTSLNINDLTDLEGRIVDVFTNPFINSLHNPPSPRLLQLLDIEDTTLERQINLLRLARKQSPDPGFFRMPSEESITMLTDEEFTQIQKLRQQRLQFATNRLATMNMGDIDPNKRLDQLSDGQRARVLVLSRLQNSTRVLVLDEPVGSLDNINVRKMIEVICHVTRDNQLTTLAISQAHQERIEAEVITHLGITGFVRIDLDKSTI